MSYRDDFLDENGYLHCENCGRNDNWLELHHICYRSEKPKHKNLNHEDNLILLCKKCHDWLHDKKDRRETLEKWEKTKCLF